MFMVTLQKYQMDTMLGNYGPSSSIGIISLIPKEGKDSHYIKNMRPI